MVIVLWANDVPEWSALLEKHGGQLTILILGTLVLISLLILVPQLLRARHHIAELHHTEQMRCLEQGQALTPPDPRSTFAGRTATLVPMVATGLGWVCDQNLVFVETCVAWEEVLFLEA